MDGKLAIACFKYQLYGYLHVRDHYIFDTFTLSGYKAISVLNCPHPQLQAAFLITYFKKAR
jgi:hypothetical protein